MDRLDKLNAAIKAHGNAVLSSIPENHHCGVIHVDEDQWNALETAGVTEKQARADLMPTEQDAINLMSQAYQRLKELGWKEAIYCPKDGSEFDAIEPGSTGIRKAHYSGDWPTGGWMVADAGDLWPSHPCLYRPTEAEIAEREARIKRFRDAATGDEAQQGEG